MNRFLLSLTAATASVLALGATTAQAQPYGHHRIEPVATPGWVSINQRQAELDHRIDMGVRHGDLTRREAGRLRVEFNRIAQLEARYRVNGLNGWERADLDRRFDRLSAEIRIQRHDNQYGYGYGHDRDWRH
jgi:hypothetical protein